MTVLSGERWTHNLNIALLSCKGIYQSDCEKSFEAAPIGLRNARDVRKRPKLTEFHDVMGENCRMPEVAV